MNRPCVMLVSALVACTALFLTNYGVNSIAFRPFRATATTNCPSMETALSNFGCPCKALNQNCQYGAVCYSATNQVPGLCVCPSNTRAIVVGNVTTCQPICRLNAPSVVTSGTTLTNVTVYVSCTATFCYTTLGNLGLTGCTRPVSYTFNVLYDNFTSGNTQSYISADPNTGDIFLLPPTLNTDDCNLDFSSVLGFPPSIPNSATLQIINVTAQDSRGQFSNSVNLTVLYQNDC